MKIKRLLSLAVGAVMALSMSVSAFATETGKYAQFYKTNGTDVSMVQLAVDNKTATVTEDGDEYDITFDVSEFTINRTIPGTSITVSGSGYLTGLELKDEDGNIIAVSSSDIVDDHSGTITIENVPVEYYYSLENGAKYTVKVYYEVSITEGEYTHTNADALFTLSDSYNEYVNN